MKPADARPAASLLTPAGRLAERLFGAWVRQVTPATLRSDAMAGLLGAVLVLPQGIAFATLAGLPPEYGLYTAIIPCIIAALFGSSWHVMSGPTNANSLALFAMLSPLALAFSPAYIQLALAVTVMVGVLQWLIGALRLGVLANFISPAVLFGFTSGAALLIAVHALPDLLGLAAPPAHGAGAVLGHVASQLPQTSGAALAVGAITLAVALGLRRARRNWPYMLIGLAAATVLAWAWSRWAAGGGAPAPALRLVGKIATPWPRFEAPGISWAQASELVGLAFALTIVALGQAIAIARAVAQRSGQRIDANREFRGQGLSNIVGGFFSCYVSCGSMNRSMPNLEAGARTPLASVFSALLLLGLVAVSAPVLAQIPMAALAGLLLLVALTLLDLKRWRQLFALSRTDFGVALTTLTATVTIRLEMAILLGMLLSLMSFLYRTSRPAMRTMGFDSRGPDRRFVVIDDVPQATEEPGASPAGVNAVREATRGDAVRSPPAGAAGLALPDRRRSAPPGGQRSTRSGKRGGLSPRMPATEIAAHGGRGVFRRDPACRRHPACAAQPAESAKAFAGDGQKHEFHRPGRCRTVGDRTGSPPGNGRQPVLPPATAGSDPDVAQNRLYRRAGRRASVF